MAGKHIKIGLAGLGTVGGGLWNNLERNRELIESRSGIRLTIPMVAVRDLEKAKGFGVPADALTTNWQDITRAGDLDIVVELIGGVDTAYDLVMDAIDHGKVVVTGNKALLAERGAEIFKRAGEMGVPVFYEAAVAGGIPIIKALRESLIGNHVTGIYGIINGTSNYILTRMTDAGLSFGDALKEASDLGYAEADPYLDISGWDAAHKAAILASIAYGSWVSIEDLYVEGIDGLSLSDVHYAERLGYAIKLLSVVKADEEGRIEVRTQPSLIPKEHILASVSGVFNAVAVHGDSSGESLYYGSGAGQNPTSSSVLADVVDAAYALDTHQRGPGFVSHGHYGELKPIEDTVSEYYLRITVTDQPGVIAGISTALAAHGIGIRATSSLKPGEMKEAGFDEVIFVLHASRYGTLLAALKEIEAFDYVTAPVVSLRVEQL